MEQEFGVPKPGGDKPAVGVALWGDEGEIFDSCQYMALSWMSENCPKWKDAKLSRYLIALLPTESYLMRGQLNVTLQCLLAEVVKSLTVFSEVGIDDVLFGAVVALKGDWKFLAQCLNLKRKPSCDAFCFLCEGTLSNISPITDRSAEALWKTCVPRAPWDVVPEVQSLPHFHLGLVALDVLHAWFLGVGRDLVSSVLVLMLRLRFFAGQNATYFKTYFVSFQFFQLLWVFQLCVLSTARWFCAVNVISFFAPGEDEDVQCVQDNSHVEPSELRQSLQ